MRASERATNVVRGLLAFSRRERANPETIDLNEIVRELESLLRQLIGENIEIETALAQELGQIEIDRSQIEQAIVNLATNARDAMPDGGKLLISTENRALAEKRTEGDIVLSPGRYVVLSVRDTGIGMDEATVGRIFEPFFSTKGTAGTGLGLSSVYGAVEEAGGKIVVESSPGAGSLFVLFFPERD